MITYETLLPTRLEYWKSPRVALFTDSRDSEAEFTLPLAFFDNFWFKFPPVENKSLVLQLCSSKAQTLPLSLTLGYFLPLSENLTWPQHSLKPVILYAPGNAFSVTIAESDVDFDLLAGNHAFQEIQFYMEEASILM
ncbi:hypothetical protein PanWU01x14_253190 [Parasponia andersonii]|uniref:Uncharacterized protein n=1 Tax=Parasponia andersonii TaxID=3476 RepID=A0A2P5BBP8_PARAD|nr:hypothetical protein PanWU01x14_253190 [Parasponia andersonii]